MLNILWLLNTDPQQQAPGTGAQHSRHPKQGLWNWGGASWTPHSRHLELEGASQALSWLGDAGSGLSPARSVQPPGHPRVPRCPQAPGAPSPVPGSQGCDSSMEQPEWEQNPAGGAPGCVSAGTRGMWLRGPHGFWNPAAFWPLHSHREGKRGQRSQNRDELDPGPGCGTL